ncbi:MAG TPA: methyltransferase, partial [Methanothrix sp.]|nr:methyltransferase [Methanothrix sp.]
MVPHPRDGETVRPAEEILARLNALYMACPKCPAEPALDKGASFRDLAARIGGRKRCSGCGKAPLDLVMVEAMEVLVDHRLRSPTDPLRSIGWPLVEVGYPLAYPPRLAHKELIIVGEHLTKEAAAEIVAKVPEVKGVI